MSEFRHIIRIAGVDLDGNRTVALALTGVKGIGMNISRGIVRGLGIDPTVKLGTLDDATVEKIKKVLDDPQKAKIPSWMYNRRNDYETGKDTHVIEAQLAISHREDLSRLKRIRSYRGVRHGLGLPVRGQRTKSSFRTGRSMGVSRKKALRRQAAKEEKR
jgi:small subunit ribosomal protein S13